MDRKEAWIKSERNQNKGYDTKQAEISGFWILERHRGLEGKTTQGFNQKVRKKAETADKKKLVSEYGLQD